MKREDALKQVDAGLARLQEALAKGKSDELKRYLAVLSRFHRYSFGNALLILMQRPDATHVAGFHRWLELGRHVKKGEQGIAILAPLVYKRKPEEIEAQDVDPDEKVLRGFKVVHVFDVSQTEGEALPEFAATNGDPGENLARIEQAIREADIELKYDDLPGSALGRSSGGTITVTEGLTPAERFAVLAHEYAHELLHHGNRRHETTKVIRETEAEAVAFVVCNAFGIEPPSADYIQLHRGDADTLAESLEYIQKTAASIIESINGVTLPCNHTLHLGDAGSTWHREETENGLRYSCRVCGKLYGYHPNGQPSPDRQAELQEGDSPEEPATELRTGRADYEERRKDRIDRYRERAERRRDEAEAAYAQARQMAGVIPFGQPILVGHHSERADRNYRDRIHRKFGKAFELHDQAKYWERRANAAEEGTAISSDDPEAITKLHERVAALEAEQQQMKAVNAAWRKAGKPLPNDKDDWDKVASLLTPPIEPDDLARIRLDMAQRHGWHPDSTPFPAYALQNNNANIRRIRERIAVLERSAGAEHVEVDHGVCRLIENADENRIQLVFSGKPPQETRDLLKRNGFHWSRQNAAWQRLLNSAGRHAASLVIGELTKEGTSCTPS